MFCRVCGAQIHTNAEICIKCGCRPLNGKSYCQSCGTKTSEQQQMCVRCGHMLQYSTGRGRGFFESISNMADNVNDTMNTNSDCNDYDLDFSGLSRYYQKEFTKIYQSNERYKGKFNGCAFFFAGIWALVKGCWLSFVVAILLSFVTCGLAGVVYWFIYGFRGNYIYYNAYVKNKQCIF